MRRVATTTYCSNQLYPEPTGDNFNVPQLSFAQFLSPYDGTSPSHFLNATLDGRETSEGK